MRSKLINYNLGPLELEVMEYIWSKNNCSVSDTHNYLISKRAIAYTTVMTIMMRLWQKGYLKRIKKGKTYLYSYKKNKDQTIKSSISKLIEGFASKFGIEAIAYFTEEIEKYEKRL